MRRVALKGLIARRTRLALTALAVALGVTLIAGTYVFTDTINGSFDQIFTQSYKGTDAVITPRKASGHDNQDELPPIPAGVLAKVRATPGIGTAEGGIFSPGATILGKDGNPVGVGGAPRFIVSRHATSRFSVFSVADGRLPAADNEVAIIKSTVDDEHFALGDRIAIQGATPRRDYRLVGVLKIAGVDSFGGAVAAMFTLPEAQRLAGRVGKFDEIDASAQRGVSPTVLKQRLQAALPHALTVRTGSEQAASQSQDIRDNLGFLRTALLAFAGISLFVGAFIIFNTFSITVAQRMREFALLRTLGAKRRQVMTSVLTEGFVIGAVGAAVGLGLGILLAQGLKALFRAFGISLPSSGTVIASRTVIVSLLVGTIVTLLSSLIPAIRATRIPPVAALREGAVLPHGRGARLVTPLAIVLSVLAVVALCVGLFAGLDSGPALSLVGAGAALAFIGVALLSPRLVPPLARFVARPIERLTGFTGRLAKENAVRQPGRTAATASALMVGVTLVAFASIFAASARTTVRKAVEEGSKAQLILQNTDGFSPITPKAGVAIAKVDGVQRVTRVRFTHARVLGDSRTIVGVDPQTFSDLYNAGTGSDALKRLGPGTTVVAKKLFDDQHLKVGDTLAVRTARDATARLRVIGKVDDKGHLTGQLTVTNDVLAKTFGADKDGVLFVGFAPGRDAAAVEAAVKRVLKREFPQVKALSNAEFIDQQAGKIDQLLALIYALLALSVIVALFGIVNTLVLSITERTRELGMLRAVGTSRRQVRAMIRAEAVIIAVIGGILGIVLGTGLALLVSRVVDELTLSVPVGSILVLILLAA
ncbi:MAG: putative transport system permease protein, partial [Solirubrobacteraceae bacterium]|nr:putative transport system permease protein [Solirubrobacteraceae bacterium]